MFPKCKSGDLRYCFSVHRPVLVTLEGIQRGRKSNKHRGFKFEPFWLKEEECLGVVSQTWKETWLSISIKDLQNKLGRCAEELDFWSKKKFGSLRKNIEVKQKDLNEMLEAEYNADNSEKIKKLENELEGLLVREELYWRQRARTDWMCEEDRN
ncbi:hypothetical protein LWI28_000537 [Acer negundo]|uniref:Uncharacterized protein n=1 Tax=Acer negundo TaxID=4023 RepID=A0AAD5P2E4_ACENE|nr:hypothetical protein LWI28_000537 [Acer negundo]